LNVNVDRFAGGLVGLSEKDAATAMQTTLSGSSQTSPTYWLNPKTGVSYPVSIQTPPSILYTMNDLNNIPVTRAAARTLSCSAAWRRSNERQAMPSSPLQRPSRHRIFATPQGRDLGGIAAEIRK